MSESAGTKAFAAFIGVMGITAMVFGIILVWQGVTEGWPVAVAIGVLGIIGLPITLAGLCVATRCPLNLDRVAGRGSMVGGTLAIAATGAGMW